MEVDVVNMEGKKVKTVELPPEIFEAPIVVDLMHQAFVRQMNNAHLGTHETKTKSDTLWRRSQALATKGNRPCPARFHTLGAVEGRRQDSYPPHALLCGFDAAQDAAGCNYARLCLQKPPRARLWWWMNSSSPNPRPASWPGP
jgi:hypothetical protein